MFFIGKKKSEVKRYDEKIRRPAIRSSICTGEKVAGFENLETGKFEEIQLIQSPKDIEDFKKRYGIQGDLKTIY
ncbi:MAG: hypothetical protein IIZ28_02565 [Erysipelotrichaceae bacterium]|nr:hypothetical protein [Erysipelotrichaceae bacterium]